MKRLLNFIFKKEITVISKEVYSYEYMDCGQMREFKTTGYAPVLVYTFFNYFKFQKNLVEDGWYSSSYTIAENEGLKYI